MKTKTIGHSKPHNSINGVSPDQMMSNAKIIILHWVMWKTNQLSLEQHCSTLSLSGLLMVLLRDPASKDSRQAQSNWRRHVSCYHSKIKFSCAVPFTNGSYMLKLWVDCVFPQMTVAKVGNCWLQDSYPTVPPIMITHIRHVFRQANFVAIVLFVHQTKGPIVP